MIDIRAKWQQAKKPFDRKALLRIVALAIQRRIMTSFSSTSTPGKPPAVRTGNLRSNIAWVIHGDNRLEMGVTRRAIYGIYLEKGTGIYGPRHAPIVPTKKKALKFMIGNRTVIVRSVKGVKKRPFVDPAVSYVFRKMKLNGKLFR